MEYAQTKTANQEEKINDNIEIPNNAITLNKKSDKNNGYEVKFFIFEECLAFIAQSLNIVPQKKFKKIYTYKDVIKNNKYFAICENMNEIIEEIKAQINEKENEVKIYEKEGLILLSIPLNTKKIKECIFEIEEISTTNINSDIKTIYSYINQLLNEIANLKEKNKSNEEKIKILESKNQILENKIEEIDSLFFRQFKKEKEKEKEEKEKDLNRIKKWIDPDKKIEFNLIFKKSRDDSSFQDFHRHCDNRGKTVLLIETKEGRKFGGFTNDSWSSDNSWRKNYNDFVFLWI
jgi:hypothetical protein